MNEDNLGANRSIFWSMNSTSQDRLSVRRFCRKRVWEEKERSASSTLPLPAAAKSIVLFKLCSKRRMYIYAMTLSPGSPSMSWTVKTARPSSEKLVRLLFSFFFPLMIMLIGNKPKRNESAPDRVHQRQVRGRLRQVGGPGKVRRAQRHPELQLP